MQILLTFIFLIFLAVGGFAQGASVSASDLQRIEGSWTGNLTYMDYSSGKPTTIKSDIKVTKSDKPRAWTFEYIYPLEPKANSKAEISLSSDGRLLDGEEVIERKSISKDALTIVTTKKGTDNKRNATFRRTFSIGPDSFSIRKEVRIDGTDEYFERNTYVWTRQK